MPERILNNEIPQREFTPVQERAVKIAFQSLQNTLENLQVPNPSVRIKPSDVRFLTTKEYKNFKGHNPPEDLVGMYDYRYAFIFTDRLPSDENAITHVTLHEIIHGEVHRRFDINYPIKNGYRFGKLNQSFFYGMNEAVVEHTAAFGINKYISSKKGNKDGVQVDRKMYDEYFTIMDNIVSEVSRKEDLDENKVWRELMKNQFVPDAEFLFHVWKSYGKSGLFCLGLLGADLKKDAKLKKDEKERRKSQRTQIIDSFFNFNNGEGGYLGFYNDLSNILSKECTLQERISLIGLVNAIAKGCEMRENGLRRVSSSKLDKAALLLDAVGATLLPVGICTQRPVVMLGGVLSLAGSLGLEKFLEKFPDRRILKNLVLPEGKE